MPSPQIPLPERARGFENLQLFLAPLLPLWEKGLGDEGKRFVSQSGVGMIAVLAEWGSMPPKQAKIFATHPRYLGFRYNIQHKTVGHPVLKAQEMSDAIAGVTEKPALYALA
jgi:hypothetical protein